MSGSPPDDRCGYTYPEDHEVGDSPDRQSCCWRKAAASEDTERCLWHANPDRVSKTVESLREARVPSGQNEQERSDLRDQTAPVAELLDGINVASVELGDALSFANVSLRGADLSGADLRDADLSGAVLWRADLSDANLWGAALSGAVLQEANLSGAVLGGPDLSGAELREANLSGAVLGGADLSGANLREANLSDAGLGEANLSDADLWEANLSGADLGRADLSDAYLREANLSDANLGGADLSGSYPGGADLSGAELREANLSGADFWRADLSGVDFWHANLSGADFWRADLSGGDLEGADLSDADLRHADLSGAVLREANLSGADLSDANLFQIDVRSLQIDDVDKVNVTSRTKINSSIPFRTGFRHRPIRFPRFLRDENARERDRSVWDQRARGYERLRKVFQEKGLDDHHRTLYSYQRRARAKEALRAGRVGQWLGSNFSRLLTGHGVSVSRVFFWTAVVMLLPWYWYGLVEGWTGGSLQGGPLYYSVVTFVTSPPQPLPEVQGSIDLVLTTVARQRVSRAVVLFQTYAGTALIVLLGYVLGNRDRI